MARRAKVVPLLVWALVLSIGSESCDRSPISFSDVPNTRTALIDGLVSYQSAKDVRRQLAPLSWEVVEDSHLGPTDQRPRFDVYTVSLKKFTHLGQVGELVLQFFNDRLMETRFFPDNVDAYLAALANAGVDLRQQSEAEVTVPPHTRLSTAIDYRKRRYVGWEDIRLAEEMKRWIKRYA